MVSTPVEQFKVLIVKQKNCRLKRPHPLMTAYDNELKALFKKTFPRKKKFDASLLDKAQVEAILAKYKPLADAIMERIRVTSEKLEKRLTELAQDIPVAPMGDSWSVYESIYKGAYRSQGFGAEKYLQQSAELAAMTPAAYGIPFKFEDNGGSRNVLVNLDEVHCEVLQRKPGPSLAEIVRTCWARGVNPRVYYPFLPHDFEERNGFDYFGKQLSREQQHGVVHSC